MLDDTCYFLPFDDEATARRAANALRSELARAFFAARIFWDAKRPITKSLLQTLDLARLVAALASLSANRHSAPASSIASRARADFADSHAVLLPALQARS